MRPTRAMLRSGSSPPASTSSGEGRPVAFICRSGARSARATRQARAAGIDAHNVRGGMIAWDRAGLPTTTGGASRRRR